MPPFSFFPGRASGGRPDHDTAASQPPDPDTLAALERHRHDDDRHTISHFSRLLSRHGTSHASLEWNSRESQERRFEALVEIGVRAGDSLLDVGCGTGDLLAWLERRHLEVTYTGTDLTPMMVEHARGRFPEHVFVQGCLLDGLALPTPQVDWVLASGIFAHRRDRPDAYMRDMIAAMLPLARKGVAVNSLSLKAPDNRRWRLYHADPDAMIAWATDQVPHAVLREDYDPNDFTLYLYTDPAIARATPWRP
ncbi:class I SAM-dependent methyltransferase [uncultured Rhodospira sp.]|uniref:class I SAM-dependent methyltransferase n=1 Tax=uncultured Rhodospira sp. TaxID=1936189 RepID=UPI00262D12D0|nr:class I SAM-dependent methyltransferase [uncultured Rhodospira sp.]